MIAAVKRLRPTILRMFPYVFYGLVLLCLGIYLASIDYERLDAVRLHWGYLALATAFGLAARFWGAYVWTVILRSLGASSVRLSRELLLVYAKSWLGRYVPGSAPWIVGKIYFAAKLGISKNKLAVSSLLEAALQIIVQFIFAGMFLLADPRTDTVPTETRLALVAVCVGLGVSLVPAVFNRIIRTAYRIVKKRAFPVEHEASTATVVRGFALFSVASILNGVSLFLVTKAVFPELAFSEIFFVMGASMLAGALSMLAVFAPGGIGVREGVLIALLSAILPIEIAVVVAVVTRIWSILVDLLFLGLAAVRKVI